MSVTLRETLLEPVDLKMRINPCDDLIGLKRLGNVIHRPKIQPLHLVFGVAQGGKKNNRGIPCQRILFNSLANLVTINIRHHDVQ